MQIVTKQNQTMLDIALEYFGDAGKAYDIALLNEWSVTAQLTNVELTLPDLPVKKKVIDALKNTVPASNYVPVAVNGVDEFTSTFTVKLPPMFAAPITTIMYRRGNDEFVYSGLNLGSTLDVAYFLLKATGDTWYVLSTVNADLIVADANAKYPALKINNQFFTAEIEEL